MSDAAESAPLQCQFIRLNLSSFRIIFVILGAELIFGATGAACRRVKFQKKSQTAL